jgi:hypothetical protein
MTTKHPVGQMAHCLRTVAVHMSTQPGTPARILNYGDEIVLTADIVAANRTRDGRCALVEDIGQPGHPLASGPWPADRSRIEPGSYAEDVAREAARAAALQLPTEAEQRRALDQARVQYGPPSSAKSSTLRIYS